MKAKCFMCQIGVPTGLSMEELLIKELPVFCSTTCANGFPNNGTDLFAKRMNEIRDWVKRENQEGNGR